MKMKKYMYLVLLVFGFIACSSANNESSSSPEMMTNQETDGLDMVAVSPITGATTGGVEVKSGSSMERKLTKDANIEFRTDDAETTYSLIKNALGGYGAYISNESTFNYDTRKGYDLYLRVPTDKFDSLINFILEKAPIDKLVNKSTQITDVTEEFIDLEARMKVKKELEQKLVQLLQKAANLTETLEVQRQLTDLRAEIESIEGRYRYISNQVKYSNLRISFYKETGYNFQFWYELKSAFGQGWRIFLQMITFIANLWVFLLFALMAWFAISRYRRSKRNKSSVK